MNKETSKKNYKKKQTERLLLWNSFIYIYLFLKENMKKYVYEKW